MDLSGLKNIWIVLIVAFVALTVVAIYNTSRIGVLRLPISTTTVVLSLLLPTVQLFECGWLLFAAKLRTSIAIDLAWIASILDGALITLASYQSGERVMVCSLESTWRQWFQTKDANAIRRIQNSFECCGLRSNLDQAWPFPDRTHKPDACRSTYHRTDRCYDGWSQATRNALFTLMIVGIMSLGLKVILCIGLQLRRSPGRIFNPRWYSPSQGRQSLLAAQEQEHEYADETTRTSNIVTHE